MMPFYIIAAVVGLPLVGYAILAGEGDGGEAGDLEAGGIVAYLSLGTLAFFFGFFGLAGLATTWFGAAPLMAFSLAVVAGLAGGVSHRGLLGYVKRTSASSHVLDTDFTGKAATVVIPIHTGKRGRIALQLGGQRHYLTAELAPGGGATLETGSSVVILEIERGVAHVTHLDPELA